MASNDITRSLVASLLLSGASAPSLAQHFTGLNISYQFGDARTGVYGLNYSYPTQVDFASAKAQGMNVARVPIKWERIQHSLYAPLDTIEMARLDAMMANADAVGINVLLDLHNYGLYDNGVVGTPAVPDAAFADVWRRLGDHYRGRHVIFGLMNEPHGIPAAQWAQSAAAALLAVREARARNLVLVPGMNWSGAYSWTQPAGSSNADVFANLKDPASAMVFEMHQYLDVDSSGTHTGCVNSTIGSQRLAAATAWLRTTKHQAFLGEFGTSADPVCLAALQDLLNYMKLNADVWMGWTYWVAGTWWGNYPFSVQPNADGSSKPQMAVLRQFGKAPLR